MGKVYKELAEELVEAGHILYGLGMVPATSGNFSARIEGNRFAITVSGRHKGRMTTADIMEIDGAGRSRDGRRPSAETALHLQIYRRFPDVHAILHPHSLYATLLSRHVSEEIVLTDYELLKAFPGIDTHETRLHVPVFENDQDILRLAQIVEDYMESHQPVHCYLIRGHGFYTWGESVQAALKHVEALDFLFRCELMIRGVKEP
jgi:methylthioribulose-1-phosphate dehydratase